MKRRLLKQNIGKLYLYWFFHALIFAYVIERLYWEQRGITVVQVVILEIFYTVIVSLLEVPTGYLADRWSRKWLMVLGAFCTCLEFGTLIWATSFAQFALAIFWAAIHKALTSGTSNALLYDTLKGTHQSDEFEKQVGRIAFIDGLATTAAALAGSWIAVKFNFSVAYWLSFWSTVLSFVISFTLTEPVIATPHRPNGPETKEVSVQKALFLLTASPGMMIVLACGVLTGASMVYPGEFWQLYLRQNAIPVGFFGFVSASNGLAGSWGNLLAYRLKGVYAYRTVLGATLAVMAAGFSLMALIKGPGGIGLILLIYLAAGLVDPLVAGYLHHRTPSNLRATVESLQSLALRITTALIGIVFAFCVAKTSLNNGFLVIGALLLVYGVIFMPLSSQHLSEPEQFEQP